jgi:hypothetical protein
MENALDFAGVCVVAVVFTLLTLLIRAGRNDP